MMCLVIDTCIFHSVFNPDSKNHAKFQPVMGWLTTGRGKIIFGGSKFKKEIKGTFLRILADFERKGRIVRVSDAHVDKVGKELKGKIDHKDFDDEHLVALVIITKCCVVCTDDKRAMPFLKGRGIYPKGTKPPKIYHSKKNASLCRNEHIVAACR